MKEVEIKLATRKNQEIARQAQGYSSDRKCKYCVNFGFSKAYSESYALYGKHCAVGMFPVRVDSSCNVFQPVSGGK